MIIDCVQSTGRQIVLSHNQDNLFKIFIQEQIDKMWGKWFKLYGETSINQQIIQTLSFLIKNLSSEDHLSHLYGSDLMYDIITLQSQPIPLDESQKVANVYISDSGSEPISIHSEESSVIKADHVGSAIDLESAI